MSARRTTTVWSSWRACGPCGPCKPCRPCRIWSIILDLGYLALSPLVLAYVLVASRCFARPKLRRGLLSKLGATPRRDGSGPSFWVHAVSVGEVLTAVPLVERLRAVWPGWDIRVSVSTFTGMEVVRKRLPWVTAFYFPLDLSPVVARFFRRHRPTAVILMELELWPNFLLAAARRDVPVLVANARITERSARRYRWGGWLARRLFNHVASYGAQNEEYRDRLLDVGVDGSRIEVLGNLKHDRGPAPATAGAGATRELLGWDAPETVVICAGSTHPGEESAFCALYSRIRRDHPDLRLVIVPRHIERLDAHELSRWGADVDLVRWSEIRDRLRGRHQDRHQDRAGGPPGDRHQGRPGDRHQDRPEESDPAGARQPSGAEILVVDTLGELELFYGLADISFVGGSLVPHGGHNLFEAARLGKPVLLGRHFDNFREEGNLLLDAGAAISVADEANLEACIRRLVVEPEERARLGVAALEVTRRLRGATDRHLEWIGRYVGGKDPRSSRVPFAAPPR